MSMPIIDNAWHFISIVAVFLLGAWLSLPLAKKFKVSQRRSLVLYAWHTVFSLAYLAYSLDNSADSPFYFAQSLASSNEIAVGTKFVVLFTSLFSQFLRLSYLGVFLVFNIIGFIGLLAFYGSINVAVSGKSPRTRKLAFLIVFLPSISFWSSAIGKDAIAFLSAGLFLWSSLQLKHRAWLMLLAIAIMACVRPHIAALMIASVVGSLFIARGVPAGRRVLIGVFATAGCLLLIPYALDYAGLEGANDAVDFAEYVEERQAYNQNGGAGVDISNMNPIFQLGTYLFRPLPFEARNVFSLAASIDNLVLIFLFAAGVYGRIKRKTDWSIGPVVLLVYSASAWLALAITTANLGIAVRQKWMFAPMLIYLLLIGIGRTRTEVSAPRKMFGSSPEP